MTHDLQRVIDAAVYGYPVWRCRCGVDFGSDEALHRHIAEEVGR